MPNFIYNLIHSAMVQPKKIFLNQFDTPLLIIIYHRVANLETDPFMLSVSPVRFHQQIEYLKDNFPILRFEDNWSDIREPSVVITFDDGYADNLYHALPVLEELDVPATFFISTGFVGSNSEFWWDELERLILGHGNYHKYFCLEEGSIQKKWPTSDYSERMVMFKEIHPLMKTLDIERRENWLMQLRDWAGVEQSLRETHKALSINELVQLASSAYSTIGAHTRHHVSLSSLSESSQREEIVEGKKQLEEWLSDDIKVFSYPFGTQNDYTQRTIEICKEAGFIKAASNFPGQVHRWTDPFTLPRCLARDWPLEVFTKKVNEFWVA